MFAGGDGGRGVGVVGDEVVFEGGGDGLGGVCGDFNEKLGVGFVGQAVRAGADGLSGVEVEVGEAVGGAVEAGEGGAELGGGAVDAGDVEVFGEGDGALDGELGEDADFGEDEDEGCEGVGADACGFAVGLPVVFGGGFGEVGDEFVQLRAWGVGGHGMAVENGFGVGDAGKKGANGELVAAEDGLVMAEKFDLIEAVRFVEGDGEEVGWDAEAYVAEIVDGSKAVFGDLVDVEGEFGANVGSFALLVGDGVSVAVG